MADNDKLAKLVTKLIQLTKDSKVDWAETADEHTFQAAVPQYSVSITKGYGGQNWGEDYYEYRIIVRDNLGKILEEAGSLDLNPNAPAEAMKSLYDQARRKALKVDEALSDLLSSLDEIK